MSAQGSAESLTGSTSHANIDMELLAGASISGDISRIGGFSTAHELSIQMRAIDQTGGAPDAFNTVVIPAGMISIPYNIVVQNDPATSWVVRASCLSGVTPTGCAEYGSAAYYDADTASTQSSASLDDADILAGATTHTDIDFTLVRAKVISGVLMLPDSLVAPAGGIELQVNAREFTGGVAGDGNSTAIVTIAEGHASIPYSVSIPAIVDADWRVTVLCDTASTPDGCALLTTSPTYYDLDNSPDFTTIDEDEADVVSGENDITGINMTLIPAALVMGELFLDDEGVAPAGGLIVRLTARGFVDDVQEDAVFELITIPEGQSSVPYAVGLTQLAMSLWTIEIECDSTNPASTCSGYLPKSYYADTVPDTTTSPNQNDVTFINPFAAIGTTNITLLRGSDELCVPVRASNGAISLICL